MDFHLTKEQLLVRKMYREFAENEVKPLAAEIDEEERFPMETVEKMAKLGMMGIYFPKEVGGAGGDVLSYVMAVEEMSKVCGTTGVILSAHTSLCAAPIYENGTADQKAKYLPKLCSGEWVGAFGLTEPGAGTDAQGQQTFAVDEGDHWKLNGSKIFITNAGFANVFIIIAVTGFVTDKRGRKQKEISAFIVERTDPGFKVGKPEDKMGIRGSSTCELIMEDCIIPKDRLLGVKGKGFQCVFQSHQHNCGGGANPNRESPIEKYFGPNGCIDMGTGKVTNEGVETKKWKETDLPAPKETVVTSANTGGDALTSAHMRNWMECVRARKNPNAPIEAGYSHAIALIMANAAARTGMRATFCEKERQVMVNGKPFVGYASTATGGGFFSKLFG